MEGHVTSLFPVRCLTSIVRKDTLLLPVCNAMAIHDAYFTWRSGLSSHCRLASIRRRRERTDPTAVTRSTPPPRARRDLKVAFTQTDIHPHPPNDQQS